jgi:Protein of unknown function (DUF1566)
MRSKNWLFMCAAIASLVLLAGQAVAQQAPNPLAPQWSQKLPAAQRFELVLDGEAVLDRETGLVWQRLVWGAPPYWTWDGARTQCNVSLIGGRLGWHLPTVEQLMSLIDVSRAADEIKLPKGHPFLNVQTGENDWYWTATPWPGVAGYAIAVNFQRVYPDNFNGVGIYQQELHLWCVRGGQFYVAW